MTLPSLEQICQQAMQAGLACRGAFHPQPSDGVPEFADGTATMTLLLLGVVGNGQWPNFVAAPEFGDGRPHALDRWSRRIVGSLARRYQAMELYPFQGPPWWPFQRWAQRADGVYRSPLGILIHPEYGLWHAYRGALAFREQLNLPPVVHAASPCDSCSDQPCLHSCPVQAVQPTHYDYDACHTHVAAAAGSDCLQRGCRARHSCPVGVAYRYDAEQAHFHMRAFVSRS